MEFLKRYWTQIRAQLEGLSTSQKWAICVTLVLGLLLTGLAVMIAGQPQTVAISAFSSGQSQQVMARLRSFGISAEREAGQITVPADQEERAISLLVQEDLLSADTAQAFRDLIDRQSPWQTDQQNKQAYLLAKQRVLGQVLGKMKGVRSANVLISMPRNQGFGATHVKPSASVTVWREGGKRIDDGMVESVARLVAGAVAEMPATSVTVTDGNFGRTRTVKDSDSILPTETLELVQKLENYHQRKINNQLGYIKGVMVAVNVRVDDVTQAQEKAYQYQDAQPLDSEETEEQIRRDTGEGGAPGPRANTGATIAGGGGGGTEEQMTRTRTEFKSRQLVSQKHITRTGHQVQSINVSINVPRGYFVQLFKANNADADNPTDADLQPLADDHLQRIRDQVQPLIAAEDNGVVQAHMVPDETVMPATAGVTPGGGFGPRLVSDWIQPVAIGALALVSLLLMLSMVRKATKKEELPSVEEMAGVPASLDAEEDVLGDVGEGDDAPMAGVELNEEELKSRRIAEQLNEMIKDNPSEAGQLLGKWVRKET